MENVTHVAAGLYVPSLVISVYQTNSENPYYLESHEVSETGAILAGKPLDHETTDKILKGFQESKEQNQRMPSGRIPESLLFADIEKQKYIWRTKESKRYLHFSDVLKIESGEAAIPELVFVADKSSLNVFAVKPETNQLCNAPFHNTSSGSGSVCMGSAKATMKGNSFQSIIDYWETKFFGSEFTHVTGKSPITGNINTMWKNLIKSGDKFDYSVLIVIKETIGDLLK